MDQKNIEKIEISKINDINKICDCQIVYSIKEKEEVMKNNNIGIIKLTNKTKIPSGPTAPAWFKEFKKENDARWERQEKINNSCPAWFKEFKKENDARWERQEKINNSCPPWFKEWYKQFKKENDQRWKEQFEFNKLMIEFKDMVLDQFKKHKWI